VWELKGLLVELVEWEALEFEVLEVERTVEGEVD